ncbi:hypothetical protein Lal_00042985 [Lupinus albus]|nr:hypothetical protein Lal_00042985 [Lupinus albus]
MFPHESICHMQKRFTHIVNHLVAFDKVFSLLLRCFDGKWKPKVIAIVESKYVDSMSLATLFEKPQEHEMELECLKLHEQMDKNIQRISFKATSSHLRRQKVRIDHDESDSEIDDETISLLVNKFRKFLRKKGGFRKFRKEDAKDSIKKSKYPKENKIWHECGTVGHMKYICRTNLKRIEHRNKKDSRDIKNNETYIIWDEPEKDITSTSTSEDEESSKICLMAQNLNSCQESEKAEFSELDNETLDLINANSSCNHTTKLSKTPTCENCKVLNAENSVLKNKFAKFTYSSHNLDNLLATSRNVGNRSSLGYMQVKKSKSNMNQVVYAKISHKKLSTCFYCGLHGHTSISCND